MLALAANGGSSSWWPVVVVALIGATLIWALRKKSP
jgi:hypothetical protein